MNDKIYKLTEVDFITAECLPEEYDSKEKEHPSIVYSPSTPSIMTEQILSVRERAELHFKQLESKEVNLISNSFRMLSQPT